MQIFRYTFKPLTQNSTGKLLFYLSIALVLGIFSLRFEWIGNTAAQETSTPEDTPLFEATSFRLDVSGATPRNWVEFGVLEGSQNYTGITAEDPQLRWGGLNLDVSQFNYMRILLTYQSTQTVEQIPDNFLQIYFAAPGADLSENNSVRVILQETKEQQRQEILINLSSSENWTGIISSIRLDPVRFSGYTVTIENIELLTLKRDFEESSLPLEISEGTPVNWSSFERTEGSQSYTGITAEDPQLRWGGLNLDASQFDYMRVILKYEPSLATEQASSNFLQVFFAPAGENLSEENSVRVVLQEPRLQETQEILINLRSTQTWSGIISTLRLDPVRLSGYTVTIENIELLTLKRDFEESSLPLEISQATPFNWSSFERIEGSQNYTGITAEDPQLRWGGLNLDASQFDYMLVVLRYEPTNSNLPQTNIPTDTPGVSVFATNTPDGSTVLSPTPTTQSNSNNFLQVFFARAGENLSEESSVRIVLQENTLPESREILINLSSSQNWTGVISTIRLDPVRFSGYTVTIESVEMLTLRSR